MPSVLLFYAVKWSILVIGAREFWGSSPRALPNCTNLSGLMFADGQCFIISSAEASCKAGGTATDARCGLQDSAFYLQSGFSWSFIMILGKQNKLVVQEFVFWIIF